MVERRDVGSWLGGTPGESDDEGLPQAGRGSTASFGRRLTALVVDWFACLLVSSAFFAAPGAPPIIGGDPTATLAIFAVENVLFVGMLGHTLGHRLLALRVRRLAVAADGSVLPDDGQPPGLGRAAVRTALLCLVVPAALQDGTGRALHDRAAGTGMVRR